MKSTTTIIQPLYAYGKIKFYTTAANGGIEAEKEQKNMKKAEVIFDVKQYYYSAQAADGVLDNINESEKKLKDVIKKWLKKQGIAAKTKVANKALFLSSVNLLTKK